ncbi:MAG: DUF1553 domain-containing protein [Planctomycetes bacterium]|nr:DUF1553 domain-containing protein [Planctomycetota bacterium]
MPPSSPMPIALSLWLLVATATSQQPEHWSLRPPVRPPVPAVRQTAWPRGDLDRFVLAALERAGLAPAPEADRATLLRRLTLDLTGLPPTPEELAAFLDDRAPEAYERTVDRLLASTAHGERMAQVWLDLARYTDTNGFDFDSDRQQWAWRDWVVRAFAEDMPYDRFTREQIAGDLLPDATLAQRVATGFHRNHAVTLQIDGQPGEFHHQYVADRTATFATTWLGLSIGCAECHDHKFDPISQRDYYALYAFWNRMPEKGLEQGGNAAPFLQLPSAEQGAALLELQGELDGVERRCDQELRARATAFADWCAGRVAAPMPDADVLWHEPLDGARSGVAELGGIGVGTWIAGLRGGAVHLDGHDACVHTNHHLELRADAAFTVSAWIRLTDDGRSRGGAIVGKVDEAAKGRGWSLTVDDLRLAVTLTGGQRDSLRVEARDRFAFDKWYHVAFCYDGSRQTRGLSLFVDGAAAAVRDTPASPAAKVPEQPLAGDLDNEGALRIGSLDGRPFCGAIDEVRVHGRSLTATELAAVVDLDLAALAKTSTGEHQALLQRHFAARGPAELVALATERATLRARLHELLDAVPRVSVAAEMAMPRPTHVLLRGDYQRPGERVEPAIPAVFGALPADAPRNRLGLARWLVDKDNPLVARVHVNRLWRTFFGQGLVETPDDFGTRGERPSHPELLDWLAREFVDSGFRHRRTVKLLVTSATYRQSSVVPAAVRAADPDNRRLGRASRWRLDAEMLRDQALAVAGLLDRKAFGPPVMPWQPEDLWPTVSPPDERHRRGVYVAQKRSVPFVTFRLFDAPGRETCVARRDRTTTPLQALALFNDRNFAEAARALAERLLAGESDDAARLRLGFTLCVQREPDTAERRVLLDLLADQRDAFRADPELAVAAATVGDAPPRLGLEPLEVAAWTAVTGVLLNLDEMLVRP